MSRRSIHRLPVLWLAVCALLLKAALPMLAVVSAQARAIPVAEVCTVYGVISRASEAGAAERGGSPSMPAGHAQNDACALTALLSLPAPVVQGMPAAVWRLPAAARPSAVDAAPVHDARARWAAQHEHGPPEHT